MQLFTDGHFQCDPHAANLLVDAQSAEHGPVPAPMPRPMPRTMPRTTPRQPPRHATHHATPRHAPRHARQVPVLLDFGLCKRLSSSERLVCSC